MLAGRRRPSELHFEDDPEETVEQDLTEEIFTHWIIEGRFDCQVATLMLNLWLYGAQAHPNSTPGDFYAQLLRDILDTYDAEDPRRHDLYRLWMARNCHFLNNFVPLIILALLSNMDFQATLSKDAVLEYMTNLDKEHSSKSWSIPLHYVSRRRG